MKIIADENIPLARELFSPWGDVILMPGRNIKAEDVKTADILLVRSITRVDKNLLGNSDVKFVGTATTGTDHIDTKWLQEKGIAFASAVGCNAEAVAEYVVCCVAALKQQGLLQQQSLKAGVVGIGRVGSKVVSKLKALGFDVLQNDPPRAEKESHFISIPLSEFQNLDLICLHTPLTKDAVSIVPGTHVLISLILFFVVYGIIFTFYIYYFFKIIRKGPTELYEPPLTISYLSHPKDERSR